MGQKTYSVLVERRVTEWARIEIAADNRDQAEDKAVEEARRNEIRLFGPRSGDAEFEIGGIEPVAQSA